MINLINRKFNRLTVIKQVEKPINKKTEGRYWLCLCDCGGEIIVPTTSLTSGNTSSCGCYAKEMASSINFVDIVGLRFGKWVVIKKAERPKNLKNEAVYWLCKCDCGNEKIISGNSLRRGNSTSCGCARFESNRNRLKDGEASFNKIFAQYKRNAKKRNFCFELTKEEFFNITQQNCYYCGMEPSNVYKNEHNKGDFIYTGIDRLDNANGYTLKNCVPCCGECNQAKSDTPEDNFLLWIKQIYKHLIIKNFKKKKYNKYK